MPRTLAAALVLAALAAPAAGAPDDYPSRPIRLLVTSAAGGSGDTMARVVARLVGAELNGNVVPDNRPGATGIIATETMVQSEPNGYTLLQTSSSLITNAATGRKLPFDVVRDIMPVSNLATAEGYLVLANPGLRVGSIKELIALSKSRELLYGSPGPGNPIHLHTEALAHRAGTKMTHVPYKGLAPAITALLSGEIQVLLAPPIATKAHIEAGRVRALGVISRKRTTALPDVPTMEELGFKGFTLIGGWQGWFAPARTPAKVIAKLHAAVQKAVADDSFLALTRAGGYVADGSSPEAFRAQMMSDLQRFREIAKFVDISQE